MTYTNFEYISYFDYASVVIMLVLIISYRGIKRVDSVQNKVLEIMLYSHLIVILMDIVNVLGPKIQTPWMQPVLYATHLCYFIMHILTVFVFFFYCCCLVDYYGFDRRGVQILVCSPMVIVILLLVANGWTEWIFRVDEQLTYIRGPYVLIMYAVGAFYVVISMIFITKYSNKITQVQQLVTYLYIFLCIVSTVVQFFFPQLLVESFGVTVSLMVMFFTTAKVSDLYDEKYKVLNTQAFFSVIDNSLNWFRGAQVIFVKVHDIQLYRVTFGKDFQEKLITTMIEYLHTQFPEAKVFHYSNSEFVLTVRNGSVFEEYADTVVECIAERFQKVWKIDDNEIRCFFHVGKFSCGVEEEIETPEKLKECLDYVNEYSKVVDKSILTLEDMKIGAVARSLFVQKLLQEAVDNEGFEMYYQPIYSVKEKKVVSAEALIRLKNTEHGFVSPEEFIPIAEQNGLIMRVGEFAFRSVCKFICEEKPEQYGIQFIEVNLSVVQCMQEKLHRQLLEIMNEYGVTPDRINLEITETAEATQMDAFRTNVFALKEEGINFSLDDYGTGYSNLGFLYNFPFKIVKIDKSLLWGAFENEKAMITLKSSIELAKNLNLQVVVEGVENEIHLEKMEELGCEYLQGYYFSKPVPKDEFLAYVGESV